MKTIKHISQVRARTVEVSTWEPLNYSNLYDFEIAKRLGEASSIHIEHLGSIIRDHRLNKFLCVSLLHKHFNLYSTERLLRRMNGNEMIISPSQEDNVEPFVWSFAKRAPCEPFKLVPVEFLSYQSSVYFDDDRRTLIGSAQFLQDYLDELCCRGLTNIFGLSLNPRRLFKLGPQDTLIENDTPNRRRLTVSVVEENSIPKEYTQTNWNF